MLPKVFTLALAALALAGDVSAAKTSKTGSVSKTATVSKAPKATVSKAAGAKAAVSKAKASVSKAINVSKYTNGTQLATSTVYTTRVSTITSCAPTVTNCPALIGKVITETIPLYTTICPVTVSVKKTKGTPLSLPPKTTITSVYTITKCPPTVPNCPIGSVTTKTITKGTPKTAVPPKTTITSVYTITKCPPTVPNCPIGSVTTKTITKGTPKSNKPPKTTVTKCVGCGSGTTIVTKPVTTQVTGNKPSGTAPGASVTKCSGAACPTGTGVVTVNGAAQAGASFGLVALGAVAALVF